MQNCLFTYNRKAVDGNGNEVINVNYLNPLQILSAFWETADNGQRLNVFLVNGKSVVFAETVGKKLITHMEQALRYVMLGNRVTVATPAQQTRQRREPVAAEFVEEQTDLGEANFV